MRRTILKIFLFLSIGCFSQVPLSSDTLLKIIKQYPIPDTNQVNTLNQIAFSNYYANPILSLEVAYRARSISDSLHYSKGEAEAFRQLGLAFWAQGDMATAINYYLTGLRIANSNEHLQIEANILGNIASAYNGQNNPKEALKFLEEALTIQKKLKNINREGVVLNNMGDSYLLLKRYDKAKEAYRKALDIGKANNYLLLISTNTRNLGNVNEREGLYDSALIKYKEGLQYATQANDNRGIIQSYRSLASIAILKKEFTKAHEYLNKALEASKNAKLRAFVRDCYETLYQLYESEGNQTEAIRYLKIFTLYKDSLQNLQVLSDIAADRLRFETSEKQLEIDKLKQESLLKETLIKYQDSQILIISISLLISIIFLAIAITSYRKLKSHNKLLLISQEEIRKQSSELAKLNDELINKNNEIELMHKKVLDVNQNLEKLVELRTQVLLDQNKRLTDYSYFNAHQLRSPVASILGLVSLLQHSSTPQDYIVLIQNLEISAKQLDKAIRSINDSLQEGIHKDE